MAQPNEIKTPPTQARKRPSLLPFGRAKKSVNRERFHALTHGRPAVLCVDNVSVSFDGFKALNELTLVLDEGELRCIIGPNGAGKTTMLDVITGKTRPDTGSVFLVGEAAELDTRTEYEIAELGIWRKFQRPTVFHGHTVLENLELSQRASKRVFKTLFARPTAEQRRVLDEALETVGLGEKRDTVAGSLSHGEKQWLEIGMLLVQEPRVLLVDEPVAGMTERENERTAELLRSLAGKRTVVVVEHDMNFVRNIASRVTVLHEGSVLAEGSMDEIQAHPKVIEVYLGEEGARSRAH